MADLALRPILENRMRCAVIKFKTDIRPTLSENVQEDTVSAGRASRARYEERDKGGQPTRVRSIEIIAFKEWKRVTNLGKSSKGVNETSPFDLDLK
jgi:hypothetical protein